MEPLKKWVELDYLYDISEFVENSEIIDLDNIWPTATTRYRYNKETRTSNDTIRSMHYLKILDQQ